MIELFKNFSVLEIVMFIVFLAAAIKGSISFYDWAKTKIRSKYDTEYNHTNKINSIHNRTEENDKRITKLENDQLKILNTLEKLGSKIDMLIESDKDDIKSFLTREHHYFCYVQGWIDDYSLECCERRYVHYQAENGNSFIGGFMADLRALPKHPPETNSDTIRRR